MHCSVENSDGGLQINQKVFGNVGVNHVNATPLIITIKATKVELSPCHGDRPKKLKNDFNYKLQEILFAKMFWAKVVFNDVDILTTVWCIMCTKISWKEKTFVPKWDSLKKHIMKGKLYCKVKQIVDAKCAHIRNKVEYATLKCPSIIKQLQFGVISKHKKSSFNLLMFSYCWANAKHWLITKALKVSLNFLNWWKFSQRSILMIMPNGKW